MDSSLQHIHLLNIELMKVTYKFISWGYWSLSGAVIGIHTFLHKAFCSIVSRWGRASLYGYTLWGIHEKFHLTKTTTLITATDSNCLLSNINCYIIARQDQGYKGVQVSVDQHSTSAFPPKPKEVKGSGDESTREFLNVDDLIVIKSSFECK